ncbi:MAG: hypothetical protein J6023_03600 [Clostridia bacterium]|nr:hypothetical protein [Clostridia bacterium]
MKGKSVDAIVSALKNLIDKNGPSYLSNKPFQAYQDLCGLCPAEQRTAAALLHVLVNDSVNLPLTQIDLVQLSSTIQKENSLNKKMSDLLAEVLAALYSSDNRRTWKHKNLEGLTQFLKERFTMEWEGFAVWDQGNGSIDSHYHASIVLLPTDTVRKDEQIQTVLSKNPFATKEQIHKVFAARLKSYLDDEFEDYCTADDYYPPNAEDFEMDYALESWCEENGFDLVSWEGDGYDDDFEPKHRYRY